MTSESSLVRCRASVPGPENRPGSDAPTRHRDRLKRILAAQLRHTPRRRSHQRGRPVADDVQRAGRFLTTPEAWPGCDARGSANWRARHLVVGAMTGQADTAP